MKLKDLENIITDNTSVGVTESDSNGLPYVDKWSEWKKNKKLMEFEVVEMTTAGYLLIFLNVPEQKE